MAKGKFFIWLTLFLMAFSLVACGGAVDQTVTFYTNENWTAETKLSLPAELFAFTGTTEIERQVEEQAHQWRAQGAKVSWKASSEGSTQIYTFNLSGQGLHLLNSIVFDGNADLYIDDSSGKRQVYFNRRITRGLFDDLSRYTLTLRGGEVIYGNGRQIDRRTMQWINPSGHIEAVFTERSRLNVGILLLLGLALLVVGGGWLLFRRRPGPCPHCGQWLEAGARYCPSCGNSRSSKPDHSDSWSSTGWN